MILNYSSVLSDKIYGPAEYILNKLYYEPQDGIWNITRWIKVIRAENIKMFRENSQKKSKSEKHKITVLELKINKLEDLHIDWRGYEIYKQNKEMKLKCADLEKKQLDFLLQLKSFSLDRMFIR